MSEFKLSSEGGMIGVVSLEGTESVVAGGKSVGAVGEAVSAGGIAGVSDKPPIFSLGLLASGLAIGGEGGTGGALCCMDGEVGAALSANIWLSSPFDNAIAL